MKLKGRITKWKWERGFGYLDCQGQKVFLHVKDFEKRHKRPKVGDTIRFVMGTDARGRACALQAVYVDGRGWLRSWPYALLAALLILPGIAVYRSAGNGGLGYAAGWMALMSTITYLIYGLDKRRAIDKGRREPESLLHLLEFLGGWPGAFLAQRILRHKSFKETYQFWFMFIIGLHQLAAIEALRGWPFVRRLIALWQSLR